MFAIATNNNTNTLRMGQPTESAGPNRTTAGGGGNGTTTTVIGVVVDVGIASRAAGLRLDAPIRNESMD